MKSLLIFAAAAAALITANPPALAQQPGGTAGGSAGPAKELEEVIITGTRRQDRTVAESSAPIDVLGGPDLATQSTSNMLDTLTNLVPRSSSAKTPFRTLRASCAPPRCAACPLTKCW